MSIADVADLQDPRVAAYAHLTDVDYRLATESALGLFMAEGDLVVTRALAAGHTPRSCLVSHSKLDAAMALFADVPTTIYVASDEVLAGVTGYRVHRGVLAAFERPAPRSVREVCQDARFVVVLEDLVDHTNVGAIFRSAAALGADAVVVSPRCADPLYRRALKVSMGATAMLPWARAARWPDGLAVLGEMGFTRIGLTPAGDTSLRAVREVPRTALLLGTEGSGLSATALAHCDLTVRIDMANDVDSLNVAAAGAVACYALGPSAAVT